MHTNSNKFTSTAFFSISIHTFFSSHLRCSIHPYAIKLNLREKKRAHHITHLRLTNSQTSFWLDLEPLPLKRAANRRKNTHRQIMICLRLAIGNRFEFYSHHHQSILDRIQRVFFKHFSSKNPLAQPPTKYKSSRSVA